jgi:hypothetical protein
MPLEHTARGHAGKGKHQLHRVAAGDTDDTSVRAVVVAPRDVVAERRLAGRMEAHGNLELLDRTPERLEFRVMDVPAPDRVRVTDHRDRAQLAHRAPGFPNGQVDVVKRDLGGEFQAGPDRGRRTLASSCCVHAPARLQPRARARRASAPGVPAYRRSRRHRCPRCPSPPRVTRRRSPAHARSRSAGGGRRRGAGDPCRRGRSGGVWTSPRSRARRSG